MTIVSSPNLYTRQDETQKKLSDRLLERRRNTPRSVQRSLPQEEVTEPVEEQLELFPTE